MNIPAKIMMLFFSLGLLLHQNKTIYPYLIYCEEKKHKSKYLKTWY
jgi:hypothetical protein